MNRYVRKAAALIMTAVMVLSCVSAVSAETEPLKHKGDAGVMIDGEMLDFADDSLPVNISGRIMVPYRAILEYLGAEVDFDGKTGAISGKNEDLSLTMYNMQKDINIVYSDGSTDIKTMDVAPFIKNGRTFVPVRFVSEVLGYSVGWDRFNTTVIIIDDGKIISDIERDFSIYMKTAVEKTYSDGSYKVDGTIKAENFTDPDGGKYSINGIIKGIVSGADEHMHVNMTVEKGGTEYEKAYEIKINGAENAAYYASGETAQGTEWTKLKLEDNSEETSDATEFASVAENIYINTLAEPEEDYDINTFKRISAKYEMMKDAYGDDTFKKSGNTYTAESGSIQEGYQNRIEIVTDAEGNTVSCKTTVVSFEGMGKVNETVVYETVRENRAVIKKADGSEITIETRRSASAETADVSIPSTDAVKDASGGSDGEGSMENVFLEDMLNILA